LPQPGEWLSPEIMMLFTAKIFSICNARAVRWCHPPQAARNAAGGQKIAAFGGATRPHAKRYNLCGEPLVHLGGRNDPFEQIPLKSPPSWPSTKSSCMDRSSPCLACCLMIRWHS
jgi:hypothetical protein